MMRKLAFTAAAFTAAFLASASPARAQGAFAQALVGAAVVDDHTSTAVSGTIGYRFNRVLALGVEATHMPDLSGDGRFGRMELLTRPMDRRATMFTTNVRVEIPTLSRRVIPYVVGGGGVATVRSEFEVNYLAARDRMNQIRPLLGPGLRDLSILPGPNPLQTSSTHMVLTLGGGTSILITDHLAIDADLRLQALLGERDRNIGRFSVGASYRF